MIRSGIPTIHEWFHSLIFCDELHFWIVAQRAKEIEKLVIDSSRQQPPRLDGFSLLLYERWDLSGAHFLRIRVDYAHLWKETGGGGYTVHGADREE